MRMPWKPIYCTRNNLLRYASIGVLEKPVRLSVGCTTQGVPGVRGHRNFEKHVLREFEEKTETSTQTVSAAANVTVWGVLGIKGLRPYQTQRVHALKVTDHQTRVDFSRGFLQRLAVQPDFTAHLLFTDECSFSQKAYSMHTTKRTLTHTLSVLIHINSVSASMCGPELSMII
ncbi:hypothetical protein TNCV_495271 [Trichonephila clavipes]|nr:hypothetical protein TNCV_495271 [Trichonephila clavipes]